MNKTLWVIIFALACLIVLCLLLAVANFSGERFFERFKEVDKIEANSKFSTYEYIDYINQKYFDGKIKIALVKELAGDAYGKGYLFLSNNTLDKHSLASFTIVSHELGHALQDKQGTKLKKLSIFKRLLKIFGFFMMPCLIAGVVTFFVLSEMHFISYILFGLGGAVFLGALISRIATISIEKEASNNAIKFLEEVLNKSQLKICKKFLNDAWLTYWGEFLRILLGWTFLSRKTKLFK